MYRKPGVDSTALYSELVQIPGVDPTALCSELAQIPGVDSTALCSELVQIPGVDPTALCSELAQIPGVDSTALCSELGQIPGVDSTALNHQKLIITHFLPPPLRSSPPSHIPPRTINLDNLLPLQPVTTPRPSHSTNIALLNIRSLNKKALILHELILEKSLDFLLLTETWQQPDDFFSLNQTSPPGFKYITKPRPSRRGGGLAIIHNQNIQITELTLPSVSSFELIAFKAPPSLTVILNYRPPKPHPSFLSDFTEFLTLASSLSQRLLILGDLNIYIDSPSCKLASKFTTLLDNFSITQHVTFPTHDKGHILDLVCSTNLPVIDLHPCPFPLSDHKLIQFTIVPPHPKPLPTQKHHLP
ncbi:hypothetical protein JOQ06_023090 [Pogonophryne albipinna]|uniref:Endonuclease/exonuclease/phosphatase domain-containing protein n=1 Tax=Pogonophryne albipinna TaxID=1090488 RepID=A0AAD6AA36_9TELE|nr:hypothetical protein JOQ06_023090 [Pogonophryne albipinna]